MDIDNAAGDIDTYDSQIAAQAVIDAERAPGQQRYTNPTTPNPSELIADHSAEGAWPAAARGYPLDPQMPARPIADHDQPYNYLPATSTQHESVQRHNPHALGPHGTENHNGVEGGTNPRQWGPNKAQPNAYGLINIGRPFLATISDKWRHLRSSVGFDPVTGKNVNAQDAPSAPTQIWNSQHDTEPRWIGFDVQPRLENIAKGPQFSTDPGYLGVNDNPPNRAPRQYGSEVAQTPDDPYVSQGESSGPEAVDYSGGY
jgi:hypothetical protein